MGPAHGRHFLVYLPIFVYICAILTKTIVFCKNICVSSKMGGEHGHCTHPPGYERGYCTHLPGEQWVLHTSDSKVPGSGTVKRGGDGQQVGIVHIGAESTGASYCTHGGCRVIFVYFRKDFVPNSAQIAPNLCISAELLCLENRGRGGRIVHIRLGLR